MRSTKEIKSLLILILIEQFDHKKHLYNNKEKHRQAQVKTRINIVHLHIYYQTKIIITTNIIQCHINNYI
jgi:hypothetical protein